MRELQHLLALDSVPVGFGTSIVELVKLLVLLNYFLHDGTSGDNELFKFDRKVLVLLLPLIFVFISIVIDEHIIGCTIKLVLVP